MRKLVIDSATEACSVALFEDDVLIAGECLTLGRGHAERLVPMIAALPDKGCASVIAVDIGPGSFTGIRVGLAAARALGLAWHAEVVGYESLALVAAMAKAQHPDQAIDVCMTGGHGEWFFQPFGGDGTALAGIESLTPELAIARSTARVIAGTQALGIAQHRRDAIALDLRPDARCLQLLPPGAFQANPRPSYGRAPDARLPAAA
ncbi:tRNA (adenosine(37)-N6)-threonylcarbamoyltransferase complex dimerization subunit type 1 TsaB [Novosphingobium sp.]|uniref:tRNA (adenosine(37)-N6)-threonylcarbamoyltransferase complex dimerization subunit type 1 TsaB n=1 Tax=Novosphingobium sp. TaxID=1874826 RepID=UPI00261ED102|nr:tRNA (adenosine(37)-N6)-threonylcarbamoyltransferase complex dimerization subunit type 1 TsaB [Novosphingobium sp.]